MAKCGEKCEVYSRVTGYFRPVANWNRGKQEEFKDRRTFKVAGVSLAALLAALFIAGCGHNTVAYGDGIMLETTINPETYAFGVSLRYGKILTACVRENTEIEMTGGNDTSGGAGEEKSGSTAAKTEASVKLKIGRQITGYYVDALAAGAKAEELDAYTDDGTR